MPTKERQPAAMAIGNPPPPPPRLTDMQSATIPPPENCAGPLSLSPAQWWCVLKGVGATMERANLALISAGVAFFALMAVIPGLTALVALVGLFGDPRWVSDQISALGGLAPDAVVTIIHEQVNSLLKTRESSLLAGSIFNLILALWSALQGTRWTLMALTAVNRRAEPRTFVRRFVQAGVFTLYGLGLSLAAVLLMGAAPLALAFLNLGSGVDTMLLLLRWPVLGGAAIGVAIILYRWGPRRRPPPWRWLWPGAVAAPLLWVMASSIFTFALREFPAFGAGYGALSSVVALLLWLYLTAFVFLLGGALNAELEFYVAGRPSTPVTSEETIESPVSVTGGKKEVAPRPAPAEPT